MESVISLNKAYLYITRAVRKENDDEWKCPQRIERAMDEGRWS
jgi:hypothetical protein